MLKLIVDFATMLIGAEGARYSKMLSHFLRAVLIQGCLFNVLQEKRVKGNPAGLLLEEAPEPPLEWNSTGKFNRANSKKRKKAWSLFRQWGLLFLLLVFLLSACTINQPKKQAPVKKNTAAVSVKLPKIDHIVIVVEENHSQKAIQGNQSAPYINSLMKQGTNLTNYYAIEHPSQPNYLDLFSGSNQGVTNDSVPNTKFSTRNLASELLEKKHSFVGYSEDLPSVGFNGESTGSGGYARKHNPWVNFTNVPNQANQPLVNFPTDFNQLPTVSFVIPNLRHDMHDGTVMEADQWLKDHIDPYVQWAQTHNSLLIVTWDEDDFSQENKIPTFVVGPMVKKEEFTEKVNHFNLLRTIEDIYGLSHAGKSESVKPIIGIWR